MDAKFFDECWRDGTIIPRDGTLCECFKAITLFERYITVDNYLVSHLCERIDSLEWSCDMCGMVASRINAYFMFTSLPQDLINISVLEGLSSHRDFTCSMCTYTNKVSTNNQTVWIPKILAIELPRWSNKQNQSIYFPLHRPVWIKANDVMQEYELISVIDSMPGENYTCFFKHSINNQWYKSTLGQNTVPINDLQEIRSENNHLVFFKKVVRNPCDYRLNFKDSRGDISISINE